MRRLITVVVMGAFLVGMLSSTSVALGEDPGKDKSWIRDPAKQPRGDEAGWQDPKEPPSFAPLPDQHQPNAITTCWFLRVTGHLTCLFKLNWMRRCERDSKRADDLGQATRSKDRITSSSR